jgi:sarcosine oxidase, subunit gamma
MLELAKRESRSDAARAASEVLGRELVAGWRDGLTIVNLRGPADDAGFVAGVSQALAIELPTQPCSTVANALVRVVWAGPDDWFVIGPGGEGSRIAADLRKALASTNHAVTDVSSGYTVLHMSGEPVCEVLAQGCPLDLHPRAFKPGMSAGSRFFKTSVWLWQTDDAPGYEVLVRRSFMGYFWTMLERCSAECGLVKAHFP